MCSLAGRWASSVDLYGDRVRFMRKISPEGYVFPTPENVIRFVEGKAPGDTILVLVGGSSKMLGTGQKNEFLWTKCLQEDLGRDYSVVNLGLRGARPAAFLLPMAEILSKTYPHMIVVADAAASKWLTPTYSYFLWQCRVDGLLRENPSRDRELMSSLKNGPEFDWLYGKELLLGSLFERVIFSKNLWNFIGYNYFFPVYSPLADDVYPKDPQFIARKEIFDDEYPYDIGKKVPERFFPNLDLYLETTRKTSSQVGRDSSGGRRFMDPYVNDPSFGRMVAEEQGRSRYLLLNVSISPYVLSKLPPPEKEDYIFAMNQQSKLLLQDGFEALSLGTDYPYESYNDGIHLSADGAPRMAAEVAEKIREITRNKGWKQ